MIAVLRHLSRLAQLLQVTGLDRFAQIGDLVTGVVNIVLARYLVTGVIQHVAERIPDSCSAGMAQVQAACRIRADEFHFHLLPFTDLYAAIIVTLLGNEGNNRIQIAFWIT